MPEAGFAFVLSIQPPSIRMSYEDLEPKVSSLTGKALRRCQISFTVAGDDRNDEVSAVLDAANNGTEMISDSDGGRWRVGNRTESFQQGSQMHHHTVDLEEQEVLDLTGVEIEGMTLTPERWKMEPSDMLTFLVSTDAQASREFDQILERHLFSDAEESYFPVRLAGVSDSPASWRFGECLWQSLEDRGMRHLIRLVPETNDDDNAGPGLFQPERVRLMQQSAVTKMRLDAFIEELRTAGVLDAEALARISPKLTAVPFAAMREFNRANDVDVFFD